MIQELIEDLFYPNVKNEDKDLEHPLVIALTGFIISTIYFLPFTISALVVIAGCCISAIALHVLRKENNYFMSSFLLITAALILNVISFLVFEEQPLTVDLITLIVSMTIFICIHLGIRKICWDLQYYSYNRSFLWGLIIFILGIVSSFVENIYLLIAYIPISILLFYMIIYFLKELINDLRDRWVYKNSLEIPIRLWGLAVIFVVVLVIIKL